MVAPLATKVVEPTEQMVLFPAMLRVGSGFMLMLTALLVPVHPRLVPDMV